jgi:hypothetical protein
MLYVPMPEGRDLSLEHLVLDANGTLTDRGECPAYGGVIGAFAWGAGSAPAFG